MSTQRLIIQSKAPTRVDLAGGTVDIWPLYLFLNQPRTLNLAIDLFAETTLEETLPTGKAGGITLRSGDQGAESRISWDELDRAQVPASLELHLKLLRFFAREKRELNQLDTRKHISLITRARSPAGAGLGGSSTLSISIIGALGTWSRGHVDPERDGERFIEIVRDTETTVIQVPAGMQDYYGAMFGGLQSLSWAEGSHRRRRLEIPLLEGIQKRLLLFYSGHSRNSGINNWALFKAFIDRQDQVRENFQGIVDAAKDLESSLETGDWNSAGEAIGREWEIRRKLAPGISTPEIDRAFELARSEGSSAGKICGAGGGGCFLIYVPSADPALMGRITQKVCSLGVQNLAFQAVPRGLDVRIDRT